MKVLYARTQFWFNLKLGGSVGHTLGVLNGFKENGCRVKIISNERFLGIDKFEQVVVEPVTLKERFSWLGELLYNFYAKRKFKKEIVNANPNFIYHRYTGYTFFVAKIAKELNIPLVLEFNSFITWTMRYWAKQRNIFKRLLKIYLLYLIAKYIEIYNFRNAYLIVVVSEPLKRDLMKIGIPEEKILVNANGVDPEKFNPPIAGSKKCRNLRQKLSIDENKILVGFSGTFGPWHGVPQLTEAIDITLSKKLFNNIHFLIMGEGRLRKEMLKRLNKYDKEITFTGAIPYSEIQNYLAICDILVSPHNPQIDGREFFGSPTKLFEYMAMGKGIVASDLGQIGKVLEHGKTAWLVKPGDVKELVDGIVALAKDKELREHLGDNARKEVCEKYTWDSNVKRVLKTLHQQRLKDVSDTSRR